MFAKSPSEASTGQSMQSEAKRTAAFDASCPLVGSIVPSANAPSTSNALNDVEAVSANDMWAVGASGIDTLIEHWDGSAWSIVSSPNVGPLRGVSAASATDIWAVGGIEEQSQTRVLHWNGSIWSVVPSPSTDGKTGLRAVEAISANDVWAVGIINHPVPSEPPPPATTNRLVMHWDGAVWSTVGLGDASGQGGFYGVSAVSANDVWAVGYKEACQIDYCYSTGTLTIHWDGQTWTEITSVNVGQAYNITLTAVSARATNDVWAVGRSNCTMLVLHWDGATWNRFSTPNAGSNCPTLTSVVALAADSLWVAGYLETSNQSLIAHWNGASWTVAAPPYPGVSSPLYGLTATSSDTLWAVGSTPAASDGNPRTFVLRGGERTQWSSVPSPNQVIRNNVLRDVIAIAPNDVWAVGYSNHNDYTGYSQESHTLIQHWDGSAWARDTTPVGGQLYSITALAANDVWAVGTRRGVRPYIGQGEIFLAMHWNGAVWTAMGDSFSSSEVDRLYGVAAVSTDDVWAVGVFAGNNLVVHWNGSEWQRITLPSDIPTGTLTGVAAIAANDVWAVGRTGSSTLIIHWDGTTWSRVSSPNVGTGRSFLFGVDAVAADDIWAVGYYGPQGSGYPLTLHWDGSQWNVVPAPGLGTGTYLLSVDAVSADNVWAVGNYFVEGVPRTLAMQWNGAEWSAIASPNANTGSNHLYGVSAASENDIWTVGDFTVDDMQQTLVERYSPVSFSDVPATNTFFPYVQCLTCRGILGGYSDGTFRPNANVTRGQLSKIVANSAGFNEPVSGQTYEDVPPANAFHEYVERMAERGIIGGYPCGGANEPCGSTYRPYFRPNANATRGQISKIVSQAKGYNDPAGGQTFEDVPSTNGFYLYIERLASRGIMGGYPCGGVGEPCREGNRPYFRPGNNATRGQTSKIVSNAFFPSCQAGDKP
ncbi:MAG TPA: S-layer homology domain-containing protein [Chloroflexia bacterium]